MPHIVDNQLPNATEQRVIYADRNNGLFVCSHLLFAPTDQWLYSLYLYSAKNPSADGMNSSAAVIGVNVSEQLDRRWVEISRLLTEDESKSLRIDVLRFNQAQRHKRVKIPICME